jgi:LacI family transcriptional regulator
VQSGSIFDFGDDKAATLEVITWLHEVKGHARIGFIGTSDRVSAAARRQRAYEEAMQHARLEPPLDYIQEGDWSLESGHAAMRRLLTLPEPPTAVFACNDLMALGALEAVQDAGLCVPEDVAVVGFDDIPATSWVRPRLSTVAQYPGEMGAQLAKALFERIQGEYSGPGRRFEVPCRFVMRDSA